MMLTIQKKRDKWMLKTRVFAGHSHQACEYANYEPLCNSLSMCGLWIFVRISYLIFARKPAFFALFSCLISQSYSVLNPDFTPTKVRV